MYKNCRISTLCYCSHYYYYYHCYHCYYYYNCYNYCRFVLLSDCIFLSFSPNQLCICI